MNPIFLNNNLTILNVEDELKYKKAFLVSGGTERGIVPWGKEPEQVLQLGSPSPRKTGNVPELPYVYENIQILMQSKQQTFNEHFLFCSENQERY